MDGFGLHAAGRFWNLLRSVTRKAANGGQMQVPLTPSTPIGTVAVGRSMRFAGRSSILWMRLEPGRPLRRYFKGAVAAKSRVAELQRAFR